MLEASNVMLILSSTISVVIAIITLAECNIKRYHTNRIPVRGPYFGIYNTDLYSTSVESTA